jgi:3-oxoadipate enol-lactonase
MKAMPFITCRNAKIYYEEQGGGDPVIAVHGLIENTRYWSIAGVAGRLAEKYRFISIDMRGHGRTVVEGDPRGFDVDTIGEDIIDFADKMKIDRFHLIGHSTGGFASVRRAMKDSGRFASLILANTASFTSPIPSESSRNHFNEKFARSFEKLTWDQIIAGIKVIPGPFFRGIMEADKPDEKLKLAKEIFELNDRQLIGAFIRSFYTDPDPMVEGLRKIKCPVLIIYGEKDDLFIESSKLMAREIKGAKLIEYDGIGHMTALEAPERLADDIMEFIDKNQA